MTVTSSAMRDAAGAAGQAGAIRAAVVQPSPDDDEACLVVRERDARTLAGPRHERHRPQR